MKANFSSVVAASLIMIGALQVGATTIKGTIQATRDASRTINGAYLVTDRKDSQGKTIALKLVWDENGKAIAQYYENKQIKIDGKVQGSNLTAETWDEVKDTSYNSSASYNDSYSSSSSSDDEKYDDEESEEEEEKASKKSKSKSKSSKPNKAKSENDEDEDSEDNEESEDSDNEDSDDSDNGEDSDSDGDSDDNDKEDSDNDDDDNDSDSEDDEE